MSKQVYIHHYSSLQGQYSQVSQFQLCSLHFSPIMFMLAAKTWNRQCWSNLVALILNTDCIVSIWISSLILTYSNLDHRKQNTCSIYVFPYSKTIQKLSCNLLGGWTSITSIIYQLFYLFTIIYPLVNKQLDPENHQLLEETNLPIPICQGQTVNLPSFTIYIYYHYLYYHHLY